MLTVTLVTHLRQWIGDQHPLFNIGLGTGVGYLLCNFPPFFTASANVQADCRCVSLPRGNRHHAIRSSGTAGTEMRTAPSPTALVPVCRRLLRRLGLAGFRRILHHSKHRGAESRHLAGHRSSLDQRSAASWRSARWRMACSAAADFHSSFRLPSSRLACACLLLLDPARALPASVVYPIGVSLYSVALVAYPSLLSRLPRLRERGRQAGWIYAIAGWAASALGIGMGQNLGHVPPLFVAVAGAVVLFPLLQ